jgi:hypothetical protein
LRKKSITLASILTVVSSGIALAQNPRGTAEATISGGKVTIEYGRPTLRGRDVLAEAPVGTVWRTGADQSTTFTSAADLTVGGKLVPKGSYSLFTRRTGEKDWSLIFNKQTGQWGTDHDASQDLVQVPLKWEQKASGPEQFTIELAPDAVRLIWGKHVLEAPIGAK